MQTEAAIRALTKIFQVVGYASGNTNRILRAACEQILELLQPDVCLFVVTDAAGEATVAAAGSREVPDAACEMIGLRVDYCRVLSEGIACWSNGDVTDCKFQVEVIRRMQSHMCIPIASREGTNGVLCVGFKSAHAFTNEEKETYLAVAGAIGATIENANLHARLAEYASGLEEQVRERTQELTLLYDSAQALISSANLKRTFEAIVWQMARATNGTSGIVIDNSSGSPRLSEAYGTLRTDDFHPSLRLLTEMLGTHWSGPTQLSSGQEQAQWISEFQMALGEELLVVPLMSRGDVISLVVIGRPHDSGPYNDQEMRVAGAMAKQAAMAVEVSRGYERDKRIAHEFQKSLIPSETYSQGKIHVACKYQPALSEADVGGDIYDVWPIKNRLALLIADLAGKGIKAAVNAAMLKFSVRSFSELNQGPGAVVTLANQALHRWVSEGSFFATLLYAEIDPETGEMWYANAGHESPALVDLATRSTTALGDTGLIAGISLDAKYSEQHAMIQDNQVLVLYTDGISEATRSASVLDQDKIGQIILDAGSIVPTDLSSRVFEYATDLAGGSLHDDAVVVVVAMESTAKTALLHDASA